MPNCVLMVRPNKSSHRDLRGFLEKHGYGVVETTNGKDTLQALERVDIILLDLLNECPTVEDVEVIKKIRDTGSLTPILVVLGWENAEIEHAAESYDMVQCITKPADFVALNREIEAGIVAKHLIGEVEDRIEETISAIDSFLESRNELVGVQA